MLHISIAIKSIFSRKKQYKSLLLVCAAGFSISLLCLSLMNGMLDSLYQKARIYYGGSLQFLGGKGCLDQEDAQAIEEKLKKVFPDNAIIASRVDFDAKSEQAAFFFEGKGVNQKVIKGIDFEKESTLMKTFTYSSGGPLTQKGSNGVMLSERIAQSLHVKTGDNITFLTKGRQGYQNTVELVVKGIFQDSSLFGMYTSYMDIDFLRKTLGLKDSFANRFSISFKNNKDPSKNEVKNYENALSSYFSMYESPKDKQVFYKFLLEGNYTNSIFTLITLDANLSDLRILIEAMRYILYGIIALLILIIAIGIGNSYRVIVFKRIKEIGMYKALGMGTISIRLIFLSETLVVLSIGSLLGFIGEKIIDYCLSFINFSFIPAFDIFLQQGKFIAITNIPQAIMLFIIICVTTLSLVLFTIKRGVTVNPVDALSTSE